MSAHAPPSSARPAQDETPSLLAQLRESIDQVKAVSIDVLDTLYYRLVSRPEDVFELVGARRGLLNFRNLRETAQARAFEVMREAGRAEIDLDGIYACLPVLAVSAATLKGDEEAIERAVLRLNPEVAEVFSYARAQGKEVVLTSDMYLSRAFFEGLCARDRLSPDAIFVSSDRQATKRDHGALFQDLVRSLNLPPEAILHVGDNPIGDVARAAEQGLHTFHYRAGHVHTFAEAASLDARVVQGVALSQAYPQGWSPWRRLGFAYGGPAVLALLRFVEEKARADGVDLVINVARDGYTLHRLWSEETAAPSLYFRTSRTALTMSAISDESFEADLPFLLSGANDLTISDVFARIGVERPADSVLNDLGLTPATQCTPKTQALFETLLRMWKFRILRVCNESRRGLHAYLHSCGLKDGIRVGFVDVGWSGTTQEAFLRAASPFMDLDVRGYYLCLRTDEVTRGRRERMAMTALIDEPSRTEAELEALWLNRVAAELFFSAPHPSVIGYELADDGGTVFVEDPGRGADPRLSEIAREIDQGAGLATQELRRLEAELGFALSSEALLAPLLQLACAPSEDQVALIGNIHNFDAWGSSANFKSFMARSAEFAPTDRGDAWPAGTSVFACRR